MAVTITGRLFFIIGLLNLIILFAAEAFADEPKSKDIQIIEIKKNLKLDNSDPVYYDFYLNAGTENGLKPNTSFEVYRKVAINDDYQSSTQGGTIYIPVGKLKIIYSQTKMSVARSLNLYSDKENPLVDNRSFMVGDILNIGSGSLIEDKPLNTKKESVKLKAQPKQEAKEEVKLIVTPPQSTVEVSKSTPIEVPIRAPASVGGVQIIR